MGLPIDKGKMSKLDTDIRLTGEPVSISYTADPVIGHGHFRLENNGARTTIASVESASLALGGKTQTLSAIRVFDRKQGREIDSGNIEVPGVSATEFYVGFPAVEWEPRFGEGGSIVVSVRIGDVLLEATSELQFERRIA